MIEERDILPFGRFKYPQPYTGSCKGMNFKIVHPKPAEGEANLFYVDVWKGPKCFDKTDPDDVISRTFEYSKEGYDEVREYLNEMYSQNQDKYNS